MMNKPLITIGVAVYNAEKYLKKCLDSLIEQDYDNLEILLIDDGSKDSSGTICDEYAKNDDRIKVIHKENGGLSSARNCLLDNMAGEYIMFVDNDDWIDKDMTSFLYETICETDCDFVSCSSVDHYEGTNKAIEVKRQGPRIFNSEEGIRDLYWERAFTFDASQGKLYKRKVFDGLRYEIGRSNEDTLIAPKIYHNCSKMAYYEVYKYHYLVRGGSITHSGYNKYAKDKVLAYLDNWYFIKKYYPKCLRYLEHNIYSSAMAKYLILVLLDIEDEWIDDSLFYKKVIKEYKPKFSKKRWGIYMIYLIYSVSPTLMILLVKKFKNIFYRILEI